MTGKSLWQQIKDIVECDKQIVSLTNSIEALKNSLILDQKQQSTQQLALQNKERELFGLQKEINFKELSVKDLKENETKKRHYLETVKSQKEYMSLEREIASLIQERASIEDSIIKLWYTVDQLKQEIDTLAKTEHVKDSEIQEKTQVQEAKFHELHNQLKDITASREQAIQQIQPTLRTQYERMKHNVQDPIVASLGDSCGACFYAIPAHDLMKLKKEGIIICRSCYRFVYLDEQDQHSATQANY